MTLRYIVFCCIFLELTESGDNVNRGEETDYGGEDGENIFEVATGNSSESNVNGSDREDDGGGNESVTGSIEQITVEPGNQNCEEQTCTEATTGDAGDNNNDNSNKDVDDGDGSTHEVVGEDATDEPGNNNEDVDNGEGEDNFEDGVGDGTGDADNIVETSTGNVAGNEDGSEEDIGEEEITNGDESNGEFISTDGFGPGSGPHERRKRSLAENNRRRPHRKHKHFNQKRLEGGTLPYKLINVSSLKARLAQRNSNHKSWRQKRAGKFLIYKF